VGPDQIDESLPGHHSLHLGQKSAPLCVFSRGGLLVITESKLLAAYVPRQPLRSLVNYRVNLPDCLKLP
jgi:hypothetical protein